MLDQTRDIYKSVALCHTLWLIECNLIVSVEKHRNAKVQIFIGEWQTNRVAYNSISWEERKKRENVSVLDIMDYSVLGLQSIYFLADVPVSDDIIGEGSPPSKLIETDPNGRPGPEKLH